MRVWNHTYYILNIHAEPLINGYSVQLTLRSNGHLYNPRRCSLIRHSMVYFIVAHMHNTPVRKVRHLGYRVSFS
jgi:hypothetical protein